MGEKQKALKAYQQAMQMDPANESALQGLERVSN
jgi:cytochrome c-type biogenesis protein CcmH/NrfG